MECSAPFASFWSHNRWWKPGNNGGGNLEKTVVEISNNRWWKFQAVKNPPTSPEPQSLQMTPSSQPSNLPPTPHPTPTDPPSKKNSGIVHGANRPNRDQAAVVCPRPPGNWGSGIRVDSIGSIRVASGRAGTPPEATPPRPEFSTQNRWFGGVVWAAHIYIRHRAPKAQWSGHKVPEGPSEGGSRGSL